MCVWRFLWSMWRHSFWRTHQGPSDRSVRPGRFLPQQPSQPGQQSVWKSDSGPRKLGAKEWKKKNQINLARQLIFKIQLLKMEQPSNLLLTNLEYYTEYSENFIYLDFFLKLKKKMNKYMYINYAWSNIYLKNFSSVRPKNMFLEKSEWCYTRKMLLHSLT